jgi:hypothetical protein
MKPAVQWWSNAPHCPSGYGVQTRSVVERLAAHGYKVSVSANYGVQGMGVTHPVHDIPIYPAGYDEYSQDLIGAHYQDWKRQTGLPTVLITLYDSWVLTAPSLAECDAILSWMPVDHQPCPPKVADWAARDMVTPVAMSKYGQSELQGRGIDAHYIPHTVEATFQPAKGGGKLMSVPDGAFVVMMNAANKGTAPARKAWSENFLALSAFMRRHDDVYAYIHTEAKTPFGIDLAALQDAAGIAKDRMVFPDPYAMRMSLYNDTHLAKMYTRADVLLAVSLGEGFGVPTIEAQACGTRVIGSDWAATPELMSDDCLLVEGQPEWDGSQLAWWFRPHVASIAAALEEMYQTKRGSSQRCISKASEYRADKVILPSWGPLIESAVR